MGEAEGDDIFLPQVYLARAKLNKCRPGFSNPNPGSPPLDSMGRRPKTGFGAHIFHSEGIKISAETSDFEAARVAPSSCPDELGNYFWDTFPFGKY